MHRITKIKNTYSERIEEGKVNPILQAKRAADGKPKTVIPDPSYLDAEEVQTEFDRVCAYSIALQLYLPLFPEFFLCEKGV